MIFFSLGERSAFPSRFGLCGSVQALAGEDIHTTYSTCTVQYQKYPDPDWGWDEKLNERLPSSVHYKYDTLYLMHLVKKVH